MRGDDPADTREIEKKKTPPNSRGLRRVLVILRQKKKETERHIQDEIIDFEDIANDSTFPIDIVRRRR